MPSWEIIEWSESNYSVDTIAYVREAYGLGMWAFVSDYARFDVLFSRGGVYLDTDVELLQPIPSWILEDDGFTGMEAAGVVNPGQVFGCVPGLPLVSEVLDSYRCGHFAINGRMNTQTVNHRVTEILERHGLSGSDVLQRTAGISVYPSEYFCGYDMDIHEPNPTERTISMHHCAHSWGSGTDHFRARALSALKGVIGATNYRRLLTLKRRLSGAIANASNPKGHSHKDRSS